MNEAEVPGGANLRISDGEEAARREENKETEVMNEAETRAEYIDPALKGAGWGVWGQETPKGVPTGYDVLRLG